MFRPVKHGGVGGIEGAVHHEGKDDRQRHQQHHSDQIFTNEQAEYRTDHRRGCNTDHDPAKRVGKEGLAAAAYGKEAVKMVEDKDYDLIFMDCQMPEMDGFDATRTIRQLEQKNAKASTPIIALTANALEGDKNQCLAAGMTDFLAKPLKQDALHSLLKKYQIN